MTTTHQYLLQQEYIVKQLKTPAQVYSMQVEAARYRRQAYAEWREHQNVTDKVYNEIAGTLTQHQIDEYLEKWRRNQNDDVFYCLIQALSCDLHAEEALEEATP